MTCAFLISHGTYEPEEVMENAQKVQMGVVRLLVGIVTHVLL